MTIDHSFKLTDRADGTCCLWHDVLAMSIWFGLH